MLKRLTGYLPTTLILCACLALGVSAGCGGGSTAKLAVKPTAPVAEKPAAGPGFDIPSLQEVLGGKRVSSDATNRFKAGADLLAEAAMYQRATVQGTGVVLAPDWDPAASPTPAGLAYAIYPFHPQPYAGEAKLYLTWIDPPIDPATIWVGVSYFTWDSWYWFQPDAENSVSLGWLDYFRNDNGDSAVVVVATGTTTCELGWIRFGGNVPPDVSLVPSATNGLAPISITFDASASQDLDGAIAKYEWDYDGNGSYDQDTGATPTGVYLYNSGGTYQATVRVTDNEGGVSTRSVAIEVLAGDQEPVADLAANVTFAKSPLNATLDASGSYEVGGTIVKYEWDLDGDGTYEEDGGAVPTKFVVFNAVGLHTAGVRVTDDDDQTDTATLVFEVDTLGYDEVENNEGAVEADPPGSAANPLPLYGFNDWEANLGDGGYDGDNTDWYSLDLKADFKYSILMDNFVHADADLDMKLYRDDGSTEVGSSTGTDNDELITYVPDITGTYYLKCYVYTPTAGEMSDYELNLSREEVIQPVASFIMAPGAGPRVLTVNFDASASNAPGGSLTKYEWDFDGNGTYDLTKNAGVADEALATAVYYSVGAYEVTLRVTSDTGGSKTAKQTLTVTGGADSESEPNNDDDTAHTPADALAADALPSFPFQNYYAKVGPKAVTGNPGDPDDWYKFSVSSAGSVDIIMNLFDAVCDIDMALYADGDFSAVLKSSTGTDDDEQITQALTPGTYYLRVYAFTGAPARGGYTLEATYGP